MIPDKNLKQLDDTYWMTNNCALFNEDCLATLRKIPDSSVDLILADPPYNVTANAATIKFKTRSDMTMENAKDWDVNVFDPALILYEIKRILKPTGNCFFFTSHLLYGRYVEMFKPHYDKTGVFAWHKTNPSPQVRKSDFLSSIELIFTCWNKGHTWNFGKQNEMHNFFESGVCAGKERLKGDDKHIAQKPVKLLEHIIKIASNPGDIVLDMYMGVGSTGVACMNTDRKFIGVEIDEKHFTNAAKRINDAIGDVAGQNNV